MSENNRIPIAVVGVGFLGQWHARKLAAMESAYLVAVSDTKEFRCTDLAVELGCKSIEDYHEIPALARAAVVAVPTAEHFEVARYLLDAGLDLLVEKPLGADIEKAKLLVDTAKKNGRILAVGLVERFNPGVMAGIKAIRVPLWIHARRLSPYKDRTKGVDVVRDLMIHDLDIANAIAGVRGEIVHAVGASILSENIDVAYAHVKYENGMDAFLEASRIHDGELRHIEIFDGEGRMLIDTRTRSAIRFRPSHIGMEPRTLPTVETDPLQEELQDFVHAVATRENPRVTGQDGIEALRLATDVLKKIGAI